MNEMSFTMNMEFAASVYVVKDFLDILNVFSCKSTGVEVQLIYRYTRSVITTG